MYTIKSILFNVENGNDFFPNFHNQKKKKKKVNVF